MLVSGSVLVKKFSNFGWQAPLLSRVIDKECCLPSNYVGRAWRSNLTDSTPITLKILWVQGCIAKEY